MPTETASARGSSLTLLYLNIINCPLMETILIHFYLYWCSSDGVGGKGDGKMLDRCG
jgi:hypothetical protein